MSWSRQYIKHPLHKCFDSPSFGSLQNVWFMTLAFWWGFLLQEEFSWEQLQGKAIQLFDIRSLYKKMMKWNTFNRWTYLPFLSSVQLRTAFELLWAGWLWMRLTWIRMGVRAASSLVILSTVTSSTSQFVLLWYVYFWALTKAVLRWI